MECLPKNNLLEFHPDTIVEVRKSIDLHKPGDMERAVDILEEWVKKQRHFIKKDFDRRYLEIMIVSNKGSIERAKANLDRICTFRTLLPKYFGEYDLRTDFPEMKGIIKFIVLPKLTEDHYRVVIMVLSGKTYEPTLILQIARIVFTSVEYLKVHDYSKGYIVFSDQSEMNIMEATKAISLTDLGQLLSIIINGYDARVKGIHVLTPSKLIETLVAMIKPFMSAKLAKRQKVHKTIESVYDYIPKHILPVEYGGLEKSTEVLYGRHYLESIIVGNKGSIERAKVNLDKMCTFRTLLPKYFGDYDLRTDFPELNGILKLVVLPKLTKDHYRVLIIALLGEKYYPTLSLHFTRIIFQCTEYIKAHDYCKGYILIVEYKNLREILGTINISDAGDTVSVLIGGYDTRVKGIHIVTASKLADILLGMFKPFVSAKIFERLKVHKTFEGLHEFIPKSILPTEYGGEEKSRNILHEEFKDVLCSKTFKEYHRDILNARTDESLRPTDTFNDTYLGVAGTFRTLNVD